VIDHFWCEVVAGAVKHRQLRTGNESCAGSGLLRGDNRIV
jgi:hypothetical protein